MSKIKLSTLKSNRADLIEKFNVLNKFYSNPENGEWGFNSLINDLPRTTIIPTHSNKEGKPNSYKRKFIQTWLNTRLRSYGQGDVDSCGVLPGLIKSAYLLDSSSRNPKVKPETVKVGICSEVEGKTYNLTVEVVKNNPSLWIVGCSEDFDKEKGIVQYYLSEKLSELAEKDEFNSFESCDLKNVLEGFDKKHIDVKEVIHGFSNKITDKGLRDNINNIVNRKGNLSIIHIEKTNEYLVKNYNIQSDGMVNLINYLRTAENLTKVQKEKVNRYIDSFEHNAEKFLKEVPKRYIQDAKVCLKQYQNEIYKIMHEYIKSNIDSNTNERKTEFVSKEEFDDKINESNEKFLRDVKEKCPDSGMSIVAIKLTNAVVNVCALCTFGFLHLVNKAITGRFGFYMQPRENNEPSKFTDAVHQSNNNVSRFLVG